MTLDHVCNEQCPRPVCPEAQASYRRAFDTPEARAEAATSRVLSEVRAERRAQDAKWGEQNHNDHDPALSTRPGGATPERLAQEYEIPTAARAKFMCQTEFRAGNGSWSLVLVEELAEAVGARATAELRAELVQVAAVAVAWIEAIDRRG